MDRYADRNEAGLLLTQQLSAYANINALVMALPRGGVPVAVPVARQLHAEFDVLLVRKLGLPGQPEFAMGAVATGGVRVLNDDVLMQWDVQHSEIEQVTQSELRELARRERLYRRSRSPPMIDGRVVIIVDDGIATGSTMEAAIAAVSVLNPAELVIAVPVAPLETAERISRTEATFVCPLVVEHFLGVGQFYRDFSQLSDDQVRALLTAAWSHPVEWLSASLWP